MVLTGEGREGAVGRAGCSRRHPSVTCSRAAWGRQGPGGEVGTWGRGAIVPGHTHGGGMPPSSRPQQELLLCAGSGVRGGNVTGIPPNRPDAFRLVNGPQSAQSPRVVVRLERKVPRKENSQMPPSAVSGRLRLPAPVRPPGVGPLEAGQEGRQPFGEGGHGAPSQDRRLQVPEAAQNQLRRPGRAAGPRESRCQAPRALQQAPCGPTGAGTAGRGDRSRRWLLLAPGGPFPLGLFTGSAARPPRALRQGAVTGGRG